ncbi:hypothetical protein L798_14092 [Zootermopsis nevadensis]|uniref:Uncharacterized protein n=1 Tax=Zootermopsis nevadensis TaxID=136037 RepID=A0A067R2V9_ZOONE|nr:hypothetical protein L798_14092 [Zootermopsis nevadensis]
MENDVDTLSEKDCIAMVTDEVNVQSALSITEDETEILTELFNDI